MSSTLRTIIIGGGQAGLAAAAALVRRGLQPETDFLILERNRPDGLAWRTRWDSLRLFTPAWYSHLPGLRHDGDPRRRLPGAEMADYLDRYRARLGLRPLWGTQVNEILEDHHGHSYLLITNQGEFRTRNVIVATGPYSRPNMPTWVDALPPHVVTLHSSQYLRPSQMVGESALVVGAGNSGVQIARELSTTKKVQLSVSSPTSAVPERIAGVDLFTIARTTGLLRAPVPASLAAALSKREPIIGPGIIDLESRGVKLRPRVRAVDQGRILFDDGSNSEVSNVVLATGYKAGYELAGRALPNRRGATSRVGVFTMGAPWQSSRGSSLIGGTGRDAAMIAAQIARRP